MPPLPPREPSRHLREPAALAIRAQLLAGTTDFIHVPAGGLTGTPQTILCHAPAVLFPGAFNPFHSGHRRMAELAASRLAQPVTLELSIVNVDKRPLDFVEIDERLQGLIEYDVLLTRAATFTEKASLAPGCWFVVGVDTIVRIAAPRYYGGNTARRDAAIRTLAKRGCQFLVFGRQLDGEFQVVEDVELPHSLRALCESVSAREFRDDLSSTQLRDRRKSAPDHSDFEQR